MDELDRSLLAVLRQDARASLSEIALKVGVSRSTARARIARLEKRGDIVGYRAVVKADLAEAPVRGIMMIAIEGRGTERIIRLISGLSDVSGVHCTNGRWDLIVEIATQTLEMFDATLHHIRQIDGVTSSETSLLLATRKRT